MAGVADALKDIATIVSALVGGVGFLLGLVLCGIAFVDARTAAPKKKPDGALEPLGVPDAVVKILPDLIKTSAGIAVAVLLLSTVLLTGLSLSAGVSDDDGASVRDLPRLTT